MLEQFEKLRKHMSTKEGRQQATAFRKRLKRSEDYADRLEAYFRNTLDGANPEEEKANQNL
tara:strand:- start:100 stop:282 length:183 start_codon:yes stop_codon:yes gene_type:complete